MGGKMYFDDDALKAIKAAETVSDLAAKMKAERFAVHRHATEGSVLRVLEDYEEKAGK